VLVGLRGAGNQHPGQIGVASGVVHAHRSQVRHRRPWQLSHHPVSRSSPSPAQNSSLSSHDGSGQRRMSKCPSVGVSLMTAIEARMGSEGVAVELRTTKPAHGL
jgi:hypothetical protein